MTNCTLLENEIKKSGCTKKHIAKQLNITTAAFYNKRKGVRDFTVAEMVKLCDVLNISKTEREQIFLSQ